MTTIEKFFQIPSTLITKLELLEKMKYIFRGVSLNSHTLSPRACREHEIKDNIKNFPIHFEIIVDKWFKHDEIIQIISECCLLSRDQIIKNSQINRFLFLHFYLMVCNYSLFKYKEENPQKIYSYEKFHLELRNSQSWVDINTFVNIIKNTIIHFPSREGIGWKMPGKVQNEISGLDMSFQQHYNISTFALDWTKKYLNAIYFSIEEHMNTKIINESGIFISPSDVRYNKWFSIYALKPISDDNLNSPILIKEIDHSIENKRALNQSGLLSYFTEACSFYMRHWRFPIIEDYLQNNQLKSFKLEKLSLQRTVSNLDYLKKILDHNGIHKEFIYPD